MATSPNSLRHEQSGHHHDVRQIQKELGSLRRDRDKSAGDRAALEVAQEVISAKMFLAGIDRFGRPVSFGSFRSSHANGHIFAVGNLLFVMTPRFVDVPIWLDAGCCIILTSLALGALGWKAVLGPSWFVAVSNR